MSPLIPAALFGVALALVVVAFVLVRNASVDRSAAALLVGETTSGPRRARQQGSLLRSLLPPAPDLLIARADLKALELRLNDAGRPYGLDAIELVRLRTLAALLVAAIALLLLAGSSPIVLFAVGLAALAGGYRLPDMWLSSLARGRQDQIRRTLPDTLDPLVLAMDAGMDLEAAIRRLAPRVRGPLGEAIEDVLAELDAGFSLTQALTRLQTRTSSTELSELVSLIQQSRKLGVGLSAALRERSQEMRVRRRLLAQGSAQQAPLKMTIPLVVFFLPALMIVFLAPAILSFIGGG